MKNVILIVIAIAALGGAVVVGRNYFANKDAPTSDFAAEEHWQCQDCENFFTLTHKEIMALDKAGQGDPTCPECGSEFVVRVFKCPYCGEPVPPSGHGDVPEECPHCGKYLDPNLGG